MSAAGAADRNSSAGVLLPIFAFTEQAWSAPFFVFAVAGLVSIGAMGLQRLDAPHRRANCPPRRIAE